MAKKTRKRHVQLAMEFRTWGGARKGAGRKPGGWRSKVAHGTREKFERLSVIHVTLRLVDGVPSLRTRSSFQAVRKATIAMLRRTNFRIVHMSLEKDHIHLIVEAQNDNALSSGMRAFANSAAQNLNRTMNRHGKVFDRYHSRVLGTPTEVRNCLNYVLNNWRHHDQDEVSLETIEWDVDYFSSAPMFDGWLETGPLRYNPLPELRLCMAAPQSWLLATGWRKAGGPISMYAVPGS